MRNEITGLPDYKPERALTYVRISDTSKKRNRFMPDGEVGTTARNNNGIWQAKREKIDAMIAAGERSKDIRDAVGCTWRMIQGRREKLRSSE